VFLKISSTANAFLYQGSDGKNYIVDENFLTDSPYISGAFEYSKPLGVLGYNGSILSGIYSGSGSFFDADISASNSHTQILDASYILRNLNTFSNPVAYFTYTSPPIGSFFY